MKREATGLYWDLVSCRLLKVFSGYLQSVVGKCMLLVLTVLLLRFTILSISPNLNWLEKKQLVSGSISSTRDFQNSVRRDKFLEVPQIVWGLNNQKIAFARAALTAQFLGRTLLMPKLSASLFYKEIDLLQPIDFDKVFQFERFHSLCDGFVRLGRFSDLLNLTAPFEMQKGSGRKWTAERDLNQLKQCKQDPIDQYEVIRIVGKNPFLWHDHWPAKEYARIFECLAFVTEISNEADKVISRIREESLAAKNENEAFSFESKMQSAQPAPYIAVHMRIEKDWMIHCKKLEQRYGINEICSGKDEIIERVGRITGLKYPTVVYLAIADSLLEDRSVLNGWKEGLLPFEKKKLGVWDVYEKHPYLIRSAIDYEVCSRADVFVGNSFSTFSSLVVLDRTQKLVKDGVTESCGHDKKLASYAYNVLDEFGGPRRWMTDMSDASLQAISYGTNNISCKTPPYT